MSISAPALAAHAPTTRPASFRLWPGPAPLARGDAAADVPTITPFLPAGGNPSGAAVIVCPGGGYAALMDTYEGADVCRFFNEHGIAAFLLHYRVAPYRFPAPFLDARRAIRTLRARAREFHIDPHKIGIMGFSAGGHLAASAAVFFDRRIPTTAPARDGIDRRPARPDFAILAYPVISLLPPYGHMGSRDNLLGPDAPKAVAESLSPELHVTGRTPPCFIVHGLNDHTVDFHNAELFYDALAAHHDDAELLLLANGPHGFGLHTRDPQATPWTTECLDFLRQIHVLPSAQ